MKCACCKKTYRPKAPGQIVCSFQCSRRLVALTSSRTPAALKAAGEMPS